MAARVCVSDLLCLNSVTMHLCFRSPVLRLFSFLYPKSNVKVMCFAREQRERVRKREREGEREKERERESELL